MLKNNLLFDISAVDGTCARTASVFVPRAGGKSHIKGMLGVKTNRFLSSYPTGPSLPANSKVLS